VRSIQHWIYHTYRLVVSLWVLHQMFIAADRYPCDATNYRRYNMVRGYSLT